jgi:predicted amidohydrolase
MRAVPGKDKDNLERVLAKMKVLSALGVEMIVLPPLWGTGFALDRLNLLAPKAQGFHEPLIRFAKENKVFIIHSLWNKVDLGYVQGFWFIDKTGENYCSSSKVHLNPTLKEEVFLVRGKEIVVLDTPLTKMAILSEGDVLKPNVVEDVCRHYVKVLIVLALWESSLDGALEAVLKARAIENQVFVVAAKHLGESEPYTFLGASYILDPFGRVLAKAAQRDDFIHAEIDTDLVYKARRQISLPNSPYSIIEKSYGV